MAKKQSNGSKANAKKGMAIVGSGNKKSKAKEALDAVKEQMATRSEKRIELLIEKLFGAVHSAGEESEGDFTHYELQSAFIKVSHSYNRMALESQINETKITK